MNIQQIKNTLREIQAENRRKFKSTQAEFKKAVSYKKKSVHGNPSLLWADTGDDREDHQDSSNLYCFKL